MAHRARKRFGQNFLVDARVIHCIVDAISPRPGELIVEIGPGQAALSGPLAETGVELHLVEIDRDLAANLERRFAAFENVRLHTGDALERRFALAGDASQTQSDQASRSGILARRAWSRRICYRTSE